MKYLIISRPRKRSNYALSSDEGGEEFRKLAMSLRHSVESRRLEAAWFLPAGGYAFVIHADKDCDVASEFRTNPLCWEGDNELIPIEDLLKPVERRPKEADAGPEENLLVKRLHQSLLGWHARQTNPSAD